MNLCLQLKVSDENNSKTEATDLNSFEIQFLSRGYNIQYEIWKDGRQLGCTFDLIYDSTKRSILFHI